MSADIVEMRRAIRRRRALALAAAAIATGLVWLLIVRDGDDGRGPAPALTPARLSETARGALAELSAEEKVAEVVLGAVQPGPPPENLDSGSVLVLADAWPGAAEGDAYTEALRSAGEGTVPPLIATRQEGGAYRELSDLPPNESELEIGDSGDPERARAWGEQLAEALAGAGFDLNLGPIADIATLDSPVADRAFSDDPGVATTMTAAAVGGCRRGGISCAPAHFPGLGGASQDTDAGPATVGVDPTTLLTRDVAPFAAAFERGSRSVVVSHAFYSAYDAVTPASLSPAILDGLLRERLAFEGVAITDDLEAGAIRSSYRVPEAATAAIAAGADMVQVGDPDDVAPVLRALRAAVAAGEIPPQRIDDAAGRVLELKRRLGLLDD